MTLVGKIFTVLIFVMSIVFMSFSIMVFATHKNWKEYATNTDTAGGKKLGLEQQLAQEQQRLRDSQAEVQRLKDQQKNETAARAQAIAALTTRLVRAEGELQAKQAELVTLQTNHTQVSEAAKQAQDRLAALETEIAGIRTDLRATEKDLDSKFLEVVKLTDDLSQAIALRDAEQEKNTQAVMQIANMKMVMDAHGLAPDTLVSHIPPKVDGVVLVVSPTDLIEISIGKDDGLKEGHTLEVFRDNAYLGRIKIIRTAPDRAVGQIIKELQRGQIKRGDRVSTKLS
jgi:predicted  nucleic acid-binding Zn-ribbon protein